MINQSGSQWILNDSESITSLTMKIVRFDWLTDWAILKLHGHHHHLHLSMSASLNNCLPLFVVVHLMFTFTALPQLSPPWAFSFHFYHFFYFTRKPMVLQRLDQIVVDWNWTLIGLQSSGCQCCLITNRLIFFLYFSIHSSSQHERVCLHHLYISASSAHIRNCTI